MAKVQFSTSVKYKGKLVPAFTPVEVDNADFDMVVKNGCHILEYPKLTEDKNDTNEKTDIQEDTKDNNSPIRSRRSRR